MQELTFKILDKAKITTEIANSFIDLLVKQDKVEKPTVDRIKSCRQLLLCYADTKLIGIGAIKPKTKSDFNVNKADLVNIENQFVWELGYFFTDINFRGYGISTTIARLLLKEKDKENIMASTELYPDNAMIKVLEKFGFRQYGKPWLSARHDGTLGLFLKFKVGESTDNKATNNK
jgi:predicted GNAT family N-acyltransferase